MRIYLDVCCLNRPFDDQSQDRIRLEAEAVLLILDHLESGEWEWLSSDVVTHEISQTPDIERRQRVQEIASNALLTVSLNQEIVQQARHLESLGFFSFDALHLACAESGGAVVLLTTDDGFIRTAQQHVEQIGLRVENPLRWLEERQ